MKDTKKMQPYVLKNEIVYVGLEDSKKTWVTTTRSNGVLVHETAMPAKPDVLLNYFENKFPSCKINVIYEAGFRGFGLSELLNSKGINCIVTPPHTITQEKANAIKNDRIDARRLAKNLENNDYKICHVPDAELREDRQIERLLNQLQKKIIQVKNRIRKCLEFHGLDYEFKSGDWTEKDYNELPAKLSQLSMSDTLIYTFNHYQTELSFYRENKKKLLKKLQEIGKKEKYKKSIEIAQSCPGIGFLTAIRFILEWGPDLSRFKSGKEFAKFLGLIPRENSTGESENKGHITKQGNQLVRAWLIESAWAAIKKDAILLKKFMSIWKSSGSKKKAIVGVARKLALRLRTLLVKQELYETGIVA